MDLVFDQGAVLFGDCVERLKELPDNCIDSIVTDPPYGLEFMGKDWDAPWKDARTDSRSRVRHGHAASYKVNPAKTGQQFQAWCEQWAAECLRVLKPGGHILSFGGTRTYHRMVCAIEDAGFEVRDSIHWIYGSGFPKSMNVSKAIAKSRQEDSTEWEGWGTALKPAHEPIVLARKPLEGSVAKNVLKYGIGGLNIDNSRVTDGRWPADVILDSAAGAVLDDQDGACVSGASRFFKQVDWEPEYDAPFIYQAKASKKERNAGVEHIPAVFSPTMGNGIGGKEHDPDTATPKHNHHPTVKPVALMRYLIRMVTPPDGIVLDPFMGSGTTAVAAIQEGFSFVGCEFTEDYLPIVQGRIEYALNPDPPQVPVEVPEPVLVPDTSEDKVDLSSFQEMFPGLT